MKGITKIIARYGETDQMGIVHHSVYPIWFEVGRNEFMKELKVPYSSLEKEGYMLPLSDLTCTFIRPSYFEDELDVITCIAKVTPSRVVFSYEVKRGEDRLATGYTTHAFVDKKTFAPCSIKKRRPDLYQLLKEECVNE